MQLERLKQFYERLITVGIRTSDSTSKKRAVRLNNTLLINAIANTIIFGMIFKFVMHDNRLVEYVGITLIFYIGSYLLTASGYTVGGRIVQVLSADFIVFLFACYLRSSNIESLLFILTVLPFMCFSWEERGWYYLSALPVALLLYGESVGFDIGLNPDQAYDLHYVRYFALLATTSQLVVGFYYFLKLSVKFENESQTYFQKLQVEHQKQLQSQKMSSLGEMAAGMAHEINNPLTAMVAKIFVMRARVKNGPSENSPALADLDTISSLILRITRIIGALRTFSRNTEHDPSEVISLKGLIEESLDLCRSRFSDAGISLSFDIPNDVQIEGRPGEISQVILNLLNNSFDAVVESQSAWVKIHAALVDGHAEILVEDSGRGIAPEIAAKIMEPFFTTKETGKGTGLGLSISKGLVESHGGTLALLPEASHTTFRILVPTHE